MITFSWDPYKAFLNVRTHGVSFEESVTVFFDENALIEYDEYHSDDEDRFRIIGYSEVGRILLVVYCVRSENSIRIISSRKATSNEKTNYRRSVMSWKRATKIFLKAK